MTSSETTRDLFDELTYQWHMAGAGGEQGFKEYMRMTNKEYETWLKTGEMPEGWEHE